MGSETYFIVWSAILFGMGVGYALCALMRLRGWSAAVMVLMLFGMAYATPRVGPMMLLEQPVSEPQP